MSSSNDPRCVTHSMSDDPHATDLAEGPYRDATAAAIRNLLDALEGAWNVKSDDDEGAHRGGGGGGGGGGLRGGSVYVGSCGAAMLLYKLALVQRSIQGDPAVRDGAGAQPPAPLFGRSTEMLLRAALGHCKSGLEAMMGDGGTKRVTFLEGEAGCHALSAAILAEMGKMDAAAASVERLVAMRSRVAAMPPSECEVLYGRCGYLHALLFARKRVGGYVSKALLPPSVFHEIIAQVVAEGARGADVAFQEDSAEEKTSEEVQMNNASEDNKGHGGGGGGGSGGKKRVARTWGLMHEWHGKRYLGCCHGVTGIALTLLQCEAELGWEEGQCWGYSAGDMVGGTTDDDIMDYSGGGKDLGSSIQSGGGGGGGGGGERGGAMTATSRVRDVIAGLIASLFEDGNLPSSTTSTAGNKLVQWCHGAPGLIPLLVAAIGHPGPSVAPARVYQAPMIRAAEVTWRRGLLKKGPGLCHGAAGNGYALLSVYRCTRDPRVLARARRFAQWTNPLRRVKHADKLAERAGTPASLFEGAAGAAAFIADTLDPTNAWFPGCEV